MKGTERKEKLNLCVELRADKLIKEASLLHNDPRIAALCTDDLIAKEAAYHKSCYRDFTCIVTANKQGTIEEENEEELDNSFDAVKDFIRDMTENPDIVEYKLVIEIFENGLCKSNMIDWKIWGEGLKEISQMSILLMLDASFISILIQ